MNETKELYLKNTSRNLNPNVENTNTVPAIREIFDDSKDLASIDRLTPADRILDEKIKLIKESDMPFEDKMKAYDDAQDSYIKAKAWGAKLVRFIRDNKLFTILSIAGAAGFAGYKLGSNKSTNEEEIE